MPCLPTSNSVAVRIFEVSENILKDWSDAEKLNMNGIKYDCIRIITVIILGSVYYVVVDQKLDDSFRHAFVREILNRISGIYVDVVGDENWEKILRE